MGLVQKAELPDSSLLHRQVAGIRPGDFVDCYSRPCARALEAAAERAFCFPGWISGLMRLRNLLVSPFGLKTEVTGTDQIGIFPVIVRTKDEMILGIDDAHLDFRISILTQGGQIYFSTWVRTNNRFGRMYLCVIMPFHKLIVRNAVKRA